MTYNPDKTWEQISGSAGNHARNLINVLNTGLDQYNEWQSIRAGRTNLDIATNLGVTESAVAELDACCAAMKAAYDYATNQLPVQGDYLYSLRIFS